MQQKHINLLRQYQLYPKTVPRFSNRIISKLLACSLWYQISIFILTKKSNLHFNTYAIPQVLQLKISYQQLQLPCPVSRLVQSQDLRQLRSSHGSVILL